MKLFLKNVTLAFAQLDKAVSYNGGDPKFSTTLLIDKSDSEQIAKLDEAVMSQLEKRFGAKAKDVLKQIENNSQRYNIADGDSKDYDGFAGHISVKCSSVVKPTLVDIAKQPLPDNQPPRSGDLCNVIIEVFSYDKPYSGVSARVTGVQVIRRNQLTGGAPASPDDFDDLSGGLTADDLG